MPAVSVIIPHYNDVENLDRCLDLLGAQSLARDMFEVVVADNNSAIGLERLREIVGTRATLVPAPEQGAGPARNRAVQESQGEFLAFIDSDCRPSADWLAAGYAALQTHDIVGGPCIIVPEDPDRVTAVEAWDMVFGFDAYQYLTKKKFIGTGNLFVRRRVFDDVGPFRGAVSEDVDWSHRAVAKGYSLHYEPDALVEHPARRDWQELVRKWQRHTRETYHLVRQKRFGLLRWLAMSWALVVSPLMHAGVIMRSKALQTWRQRIDAISVLFRIRWFRFLEAHRILLK